MKYAKKMIVVPFIQASIENPSEKYLVDLDNQMSKILTKNDSSIDDKIKLYAQTLIQFKQKYDPSSFHTKDIVGNISSQMSELIQIFKPEIEERNKVSKQNANQAHQNIKQEDLKNHQSTPKSLKLSLSDNSESDTESENDLETDQSSNNDQTIEEFDEDENNVALYGTPAQSTEELRNNTNITPKLNSNFMFNNNAIIKRTKPRINTNTSNIMELRKVNEINYNEQELKKMNEEKEYEKLLEEKRFQLLKNEKADKRKTITAQSIINKKKNNLSDDEDIEKTTLKQKKQKGNGMDSFFKNWKAF